jgi:hypothetical protein
MRFRSKVHGIALAAAGGAVVLAGMVIATPGTALADVAPGQLELCANGNYTADAQFPQANTSTVEIPAGTCLTVGVPGGGAQAVDIFGFFNTHPDQSFFVGETETTGAPELCRAEGTTTDPDFTCDIF